jgi:hypothetical protein
VLAGVKAEPDRDKRAEMLFALGHVRDPARLQTALALALDPAFDLRESIGLLLTWSTQTTRATIDAFYREHEAELTKRMPTDEVQSGVGRLASIFTGACDGSRRDDIARDVTTRLDPLPGGSRIAHQVLEELDRCIASRTVLEPAIRSWLGGLKVYKPDAKHVKRANK